MEVTQAEGARRRTSARALSGRSEMEAVAKEFSKGPPATEGLILRCVLQYFERSGADIELARRTREYTLDLLLKDIRKVMRKAYADAYSEEDALRYQRRLGTMTTKVKKVFLDRELDTGEVMLAAGLKRTRLGSLVETVPSQSLFGRLFRDARARAGDGRKKRSTVPGRVVSMETVVNDLDTLVKVDADALWETLVPWLRAHDFEVIDLEADPETGA